MNATGVPRAELIAALRRGAAGYLPAVAAIELLIGQGHWLRRLPFLACLTYYPADQWSRRVRSQSCSVLKC